MLSAIVKGNSVILGATVGSIGLGMAVGSLVVYSWQNEPTDIGYWNSKWKQYRSEYPSILNPPWEEYSQNNPILTRNHNECLEFLTPKLPKLTNPAQIKSIRILVPLCGANQDLQIINDFVTNKINSETDTKDEANQYRLKIIGVDGSQDAIQMFLDKIDMFEKEIDIGECDYNGEYNFANNQMLYSIDEDIFSKINIYKHKNYHLINSDIFDASMPRLILRADAIYDSQSLSVINPNRRNAYVLLMQRIISRKAKILLVTERYNLEDRDSEQQYTSPYPIHGKEEVYDLYKTLVNNEPKNIKLLQSYRWCDDGEEGQKKLRELGFDENCQNAYTDVWLLQCKK